MCSQTQQIDPDLLPVLPNSIFPIAKKSDLAFGLSPYHEVAPVIERFFDTRVMMMMRRSMEHRWSGGL
jgi:hypothetical protein